MYDIGHTIPRQITTFVSDTMAETERAQGLYPQPNPTLAAATEELGEVAKALLHIREGKATGWDDVYEECVQLAAMACRIALEGDPTLGVTPPPHPIYIIDDLNKEWTLCTNSS